MAAPVLDFGSFSTAQLTAMLTAAQAEILTRMTGRVQHGASAAQSYGLNLMSYAELVQFTNGLSAFMGFSFGENRAAPNFSNDALPPDQSTFGVGP